MACTPLREDRLTVEELQAAVARCRRISRAAERLRQENERRWAKAQLMVAQDPRPKDFKDADDPPAKKKPKICEAKPAWELCHVLLQKTADLVFSERNVGEGMLSLGAERKRIQRGTKVWLAVEPEVGQLRVLGFALWAGNSKQSVHDASLLIDSHGLSPGDFDIHWRGLRAISVYYFDGVIKKEPPMKMPEWMPMRRDGCWVKFELPIGGDGILAGS